ncbi:unnamed protein product [Clavelina lepadiformis]|uniref:Uncharacterized protein n=1 Tax=Clavelina lepadiformis TaxID=159417 RepID=A0ABP0FP90_CLALP
MELLCASCNDVIKDRYLMEVDKHCWHQSCLKCSDCKGLLQKSCFFREGNFYCLNDFSRRFGVKCARCNGSLYVSDLVHKIRINDQQKDTYHVNCFSCSFCSRFLSKGSKYLLTSDGEIVCADDCFKVSNGSDDDTTKTNVAEEKSERYNNKNTHRKDESVAKQNSSENGLESTGFDDESSFDLSDIQSDQDKQEEKTLVKHTSLPTRDNTKRRGPRTTIKAPQLEVLNAAFAKQEKPSRHDRERLSKTTSLPIRVIQVWFQNRRSKNRRMKQMSDLNSGRCYFDRSHHFASHDNRVDISSRYIMDVGNHHHFYPYVQSIPTDNQSSCSGDIFSTRLGSLPLKAKSEPMNTLEMTLQYPQAHQVNQPAAYHEHLSPESLRSCNYSYV